jgi:hypothetical protein
MVHDLSSIDTSRCDSLESWLNAIEQGSDLRSTVTSGTMGKIPLLPAKYDRGRHLRAPRRTSPDGNVYHVDPVAKAGRPIGLTARQRVCAAPEWDAIADVYDWKTVEEGAATSIFVATSALLDGLGGRYFENCQEAPVVDPKIGHERQLGVVAYALTRRLRNSSGMYLCECSTNKPMARLQLCAHLREAPVNPL